MNQIDEINRMSCQIMGIGGTLEGACTDPTGNAQSILDEHAAFYWHVGN